MAIVNWFPIYNFSYQGIVCVLETEKKSHENSRKSPKWKVCEDLIFCGSEN